MARMSGTKADRAMRLLERRDAIDFARAARGLGRKPAAKECPHEECEHATYLGYCPESCPENQHSGGS